MWMCDGVGRFPFEALAAGGRSFPNPAAGFLLSPAASGPQSMDGIGGGVACSPILALYAGGSSIPTTDILRAWLPCGLIQCWRMDVVFAWP
eukprot:scaffold161742_cov30-Attheya_sp.AAC.2